MEREACVCDHGFERSDLCAEIIIIIQNVEYHFFPKIVDLPSGEVYRNTSVLELEIFLSCHGRKAGLSPRAIAPSPRKNILGLENPRWRMISTF